MSTLDFLLLNPNGSLKIQDPVGFNPLIESASWGAGLGGERKRADSIIIQNILPPTITFAGDFY